METESGSDISPTDEDAFIAFGENQMEKRFVLGSIMATFLFLFCCAAIFNYAVSNPGGSGAVDAQGVDNVASYTPSSSQELLKQLKEKNLWEISPQTEINPVILASYPDDLDELELKKKKKAFLHSLLPVAMLALAEVDHERTTLLAILSKISSKQSLTGLNINTDELSELLSPAEKEFLVFITKKYRTRNVKKLLSRVNLVPVSMVLAQAAIESSWGSSRFAIEGNNLFGIWTWGDKGIIPSRRDEGESHKVAVYPTLLESVRAYLLTLNRLPAYRTFRDLRRHTMDPLELAEGLLNYSERRYDYIYDVKQVILANRLKKYDTHVLASSTSSDDSARMRISFRSRPNNLAL